MSFRMKPMELNFLNNKDMENVLLSDEGDGSFNFKYVSTSQLEHIIKDVRRQRTRDKEESAWASYLRDRKSESFDRDKNEDAIPGISNIKRMLRDSMEEVDQELMRLKEDALPEKKKRPSKNYPVNQTKRGESLNKENSSRIAKQSEESETASANILLAIPEDNRSPSVYERSPISKLEYSTRTRKSHSERSSRTKRESEENFHRPVKHFEYDYSSGHSRDYDSDNEDTYDVRPHPLIAQKILSMKKKVAKLLDEISFRLVRIPLPDGDRDLRRRQQCVMEFAIRFSRNYLYELGRQIGDIQRHVRAISPTARTKATQRGLSLHMQAIEQKLISAHQLLIHALDAYSKHMPSSLLKGHPGKLKEILQYVVDLNDVCTKIHLTTDYYECGDNEPPPLGNDTEKRCCDILSQLRRSSDSDSLLVSHTTQSTPIELLRNKTISDNGKDLPSRLSMYNANVQTGKNFGNRKNVTTFTRGKSSSLGVRQNSSRCKTSIPEQPNSSPVTNKSSRIISKRSKTKIRAPIKEDDISTMMSIIPTDSDAGSSVAICGDSRPSTLTHNRLTTTRGSSRKLPSDPCSPSSVRTKNANLDKDGDELDNSTNLVSEQQLSGLVPVIADLMTLVRNEGQSLDIHPVSSNSIDALIDLLEKYRITKNQNISNLETTWLPTNIENSRDSTNKVRETRTGAKNMQLICLPGVEISQRNIEVVDRTKHVAKETKVSMETSSLSRIRKLKIDESSLEALLKYRDDYRSWSRSNPMYTSKSRNKPWDVVAWIADKLVDELIVDVSKGFDIRGVIQKLFELEFKEF